MLNSTVATDQAVAETGLYHRIYLPERRPEKNPLVVLIHGRAGDAKVMWVFSKALQNIKPVIVSPQATFPDLHGFSWWPLNELTQQKLDTAEKELQRIEEIKDSLKILTNFIDKCVDYYQTNPKEIYLVGFSQGGAAAATISMMQPEKYNGVGILSSFIPSLVEKYPEQFGLNEEQKLRNYFVFHGTKDDVVPLERAIRTKSSLEHRSESVVYVEDETTHKVSTPGVKGLQQWFEGIM
ncbi:MAG: hypothetical protein KBC84_01325 [Proteobacteria bacterium]|nr:hypothetical protein [Pseudomonadota bacterium]